MTIVELIRASLNLAPFGTNNFSPPEGAFFVKDTEINNIVQGFFTNPF